MTLHTHHHHHPPPTSPTTEISMSAISQLLLTWFWPDFKDRFLGPSWTDFNCYSDIRSGNICPGDICSYQEYLWYWPNFDQTLNLGSWEHLKEIPTVTVTFDKATFVLATFVHIRNISAVIDPILTKLWRRVPGTIFNRCQFSRGHLFRQHLSSQHLSRKHLSCSGISHLLLTQFWLNFLEPILADKNFFGPKI